MVQATKPVKDEESDDREQKEEPAHLKDWQSEMKAACRKVFSMYDHTFHSRWQDLYGDVCKRYGERLGDCQRSDRFLVYQRIAMNELVSAIKMRSQKRRPRKAE